jgi:hypothetical protein
VDKLINVKVHLIDKLVGGNKKCIQMPIAAETCKLRG